MPQSANGEFLIRRLLAKPENLRLVRGHRWLNERARWVELVGALFSSVLPLSNAKLHMLVNELSAQNLLNITKWSKTPKDFSKAKSDELVKLSLIVLGDYQLTDEQRLKAVRTLHQAAHRLGERFGGKVQVALREAGEELLEKLRHSLGLSELSEAEQRQALTIWVQNVLNLPVSLMNT